MLRVRLRWWAMLRASHRPMRPSLDMRATTLLFGRVATRGKENPIFSAEDVTGSHMYHSSYQCALPSMRRSRALKGTGESHLSFTFGSTFLILATFIFKKSGFFFRLLFDVLGFFFQKKLFFFKKNTIFGSKQNCPLDSCHPSPPSLPPRASTPFVA